MSSRRSREIRAALRRMAAITVFVAALALTSPPAAAPTDRGRPEYAPASNALDTDPLVGPWAVERLLMPYPALQDFPARQQHQTGGTAMTPAAVLPAAGFRVTWVVRRARVAVMTLWELLRHGSVAIRLGGPWLKRVSWHEDTIHQQPLPASSWGPGEVPVITPDRFKDILNYGGIGTLRSGLQQPLAAANPTKVIPEMISNPLLRTVTTPGSVDAAQTRFARPRDGPHIYRQRGGEAWENGWWDVRGQGSPESCF